MLFLLLLTAGLREAEGCLGGIINVTGLTCEQKKYILDVHNKFRDDVAGGRTPGQPKAANMVELKWRDTLAKKAQDWANGCVLEHDIQGIVDGERFGQNLAMISSNMNKKPDLSIFFQSWMDEVKDYKYSDFSFQGRTGLYTQMIWATSKFIGCGFTSYKKGGWFHNYLVCNYMPPGNWVGLKPYILSEKNCQAYSLVDSIFYHNLCAIDSQVARPCDSWV